MRQRLLSLNRILAVQRDIRRIAELKLASLKSRHKAAQANEERLVSYLDEEHVLTPHYAKTITDKLRAVGKVKRRLEQERDEEAQALLQCMRRTRQTERILDEVAEQYRRLEERRELDAAIGAETNRKRASFP
jgi:hypothetical protein